mmetsp:Transcript_30321/g.70976  ORF Transcript_30321/g.70976 Transcript_30321/m.70976 type:complete len:591 (-) Transcript_30321:117-1889(-)
MLIGVDLEHMLAPLLLRHGLSLFGCKLSLSNFQLLGLFRQSLLLRILKFLQPNPLGLNLFQLPLFVRFSLLHSVNLHPLDFLHFLLDETLMVPLEIAQVLFLLLFGLVESFGLKVLPLIEAFLLPLHLGRELPLLLDLRLQEGFYLLLLAVLLLEVRLLKPLLLNHNLLCGRHGLLILGHDRGDHHVEFIRSRCQIVVADHVVVRNSRTSVLFLLVGIPDHHTVTSMSDGRHWPASRFVQTSLPPEGFAVLCRFVLIEHAFKAAAIGSDQCAKSLADSIHPFAFVLLAGHCLDLSFAVFLPVREAPFVQIALGILYTCVAILDHLQCSMVPAALEHAGAISSYDLAISVRLMALPHTFVAIATLGIKDGTKAVTFASQHLSGVDVAKGIGLVLHQDLSAIGNSPPIVAYHRWHAHCLVFVLFVILAPTTAVQNACLGLAKDSRQHRCKEIEHRGVLVTGITLGVQRPFATVAGLNTAARIVPTVWGDACLIRNTTHLKATDLWRRNTGRRTSVRVWCSSKVGYRRCPGVSLGIVVRHWRGHCAATKITSRGAHMRRIGLRSDTASVSVAASVRRTRLLRILLLMLPSHHC